MFSLDPLVQRTRARADFEALCGALGLLESDDLRTRVGGIYALEALARTDDAACASVRQTLAALVRRRACATRAGTGARAEAATAGDVQAALAVLGRMARDPGGDPLDLHGISLREAFLPQARLAGALLYDCDLEGALLESADLRGAWLWRANLKRANLDNADLRDADLSGVGGLCRQQVETALANERTRWPDFEGESARWTPR